MASKSNVDRIYYDVKLMATKFHIKPEEKLNEMAMAKRLGASRTPLREALNRLVSEGFLTFETGRGFFGRSLTAEKTLDMYQAREAIECKLVELACERASNSELAALKKYVLECEKAYNNTDDNAEPGSYLFEFDEGFHMGIARLSQNQEMIRILENLNARMRFVREIDLEKSRIRTPDSHMDILEAIIARDAVTASAKMRAHIYHGTEGAKEAVRRAYARIYVPDEDRRNT